MVNQFRLVPEVTVMCECTSHLATLPHSLQGPDNEVYDQTIELVEVVSFGF
jgi:hypothetical protein